MSVLYADASALFKLVRKETESGALRAYVEGADLVSSELIIAELPRALRRAAANDPDLPLDRALEGAAELIAAVALQPLERALLVVAGALREPVLRTLDAIHVAAAVDLRSIDAFVTYDQRQAAAARLAGLRTVAPGA
jgi:uncharacterized protein